MKGYLTHTIEMLGVVAWWLALIFWFAWMLEQTAVWVATLGLH